MRLDVHPSQYPRAVADRLRAALERRQLPGRFLYDSPAQAARWLAYHQAWSPSRTDAATRSVYDLALDEAVARLGTGPAVHVSLGCGGGQKDARFLALARAAGRTLLPVLTDTSPSLVLEAMLASDGARGLVVDLEAEPTRDAFVGPALDELGPVVFTAFGMVPNLDADRFLAWLVKQMAPTDLALVSANLHPEPYALAEPDILPQYDNPEARAWFLGALAELGISGPDLRVFAEPRDRDGSAWRVRVLAELLTPSSVRLHDQVFALSAGEVLDLFFSNRFTAAGFERVIERAGLASMGRWLSPTGQEGVWLLRASP